MNLLCRWWVLTLMELQSIKPIHRITWELHDLSTLISHVLLFLHSVVVLSFSYSVFHYQFVLNYRKDEADLCLLLLQPHGIPHEYFDEAESKQISLRFNQLTWGYTLLLHNPLLQADLTYSSASFRPSFIEATDRWLFLTEFSSVFRILTIWRTSFLGININK